MFLPTVFVVLLFGLWQIPAQGAIVGTHATRADLSTAAFEPWTPRKDIHSVPCYACVMEECAEVRRYGGNETVWRKCFFTGSLYPNYADYWFETADGCYVMQSDFYYSGHPTRKRAMTADPICDQDRAFRLPNNTSPHLKRHPDEPKPTYVPAVTNLRYDVNCLQCADPLCQKDSTLHTNSSVELECWTVSTMGPGEVISYPRYEEKWLMTKEGCYLPYNEISIPGCADVRDCMPYCEPPPHYWASIKDSSLQRDCPHNCTENNRASSVLLTADFDCWAYGDEVKGNNTWYRGTEFKYYSQWYTWWWPKAALGSFGGTGEPLRQCTANETAPVPPAVKHASRGKPLVATETRDVGHAAPRALQNVYAVINQVDVRCQVCTKRICPYYYLYQLGESMNFECFVYGSSIDGSDVWFKNAISDCFVPRRHVTLNGGSSISYCRMNQKRATTTDSTPSLPEEPVRPRAPNPQVSDPSQNPDPPAHDLCQNNPSWWETFCFDQALACCAKRTPIDVYWACTSTQRQGWWKDACRDLRSQTNCTMAFRLGNQMEGCEGGDVYRDPI